LSNTSLTKNWGWTQVNNSVAPFLCLFYLCLQLCSQRKPVHTLENIEEAIKYGQSLETGNIGYTRRRQTKKKHNTICVGHHYMQAITKSVFDIYFTAFGTALTTILPILFLYCYKDCYSDSRNLWNVMKAGGLAL
jgi:hypothetical protein